MTMDVTELLWLKIHLKDLEMETEELMHLYYDKTTINLTNNPMLHARIKHVEN